MIVFCKYCLREMVPSGNGLDYSVESTVHWYTCTNTVCAAYKIPRPLNLKDMIVYS